MTCSIRRIVVAVLVPFSLTTTSLEAQTPAAAPPAGILTFANITPEAKIALEAAIDAYQSLEYALALDHATRALSIDSTVGLARSLAAFLRGGPTSAAEYRRAVADASGRPAGELTWVAANRFAGANRAAMLRAVRAIAPNDRRVLFEHANSLAGDVRLDSLRALATRYPDFLAPRVVLANVLTTAVFPVPSAAVAEEALRWANEAVRINPNSSVAHTMVGQVYERTLRHAEALPHLAAATRLNPRAEQAYVLRAEIAARDDNPVAARALLDSASRASPQLVRAVDHRENRAVMLMYEGKHREALQELGALAAEAESKGMSAQAATIHATMSVLSAGVRDASGSLAHITEARRLNLAAATLADNESVIYFLTRNAIESKRALADLIRTSTNQETIHRMTGLSLVVEGKYADAIPELKQGGENMWSQVGLIEAYTGLGRTQDVTATRAAMFARKDVTYASTARPIMKWRAANPAR
jgi:tetratricopeptide (TPR) repeat protein